MCSTQKFLKNDTPLQRQQLLVASMIDPATTGMKFLGRLQFDEEMQNSMAWKTEGTS